MYKMDTGAYMDFIFAGLVALALVGYLVYGLIYPEKF